ncbi:L-rhamnose operon transcriptional activator RhaR [Klebsiella pneumoniae]|uniref:L-rhamnose operon transcriptional activator RhaR n=1 Tax=Klebsiella pneumoniae TaxID=573 RepID=A0A377ZVN5_KLEPN|nr:L-rhamnose operon transcriptional activator RhaR [Klebsiella pneumoniae]
MIPRRRSAKRCWTNCWPRWRPALSRPFVLERFLRAGGRSERALRQQFRQQTGMTINHYLRQLRICHAQYLLQHTERLIGDIAMQCALRTVTTFRWFLAGKSACRRGNGGSAVAPPPEERRCQADDPVINWPFPDRRYCGDDNHHAAEAQDAHRTTAGIVPLLQHQTHHTARTARRNSCAASSSYNHTAPECWRGPRHRRRTGDTTSDRRGRRAEGC